MEDGLAHQADDEDLPLLGGRQEEGARGGRCKGEANKVGPGCEAIEILI